MAAEFSRFFHNQQHPKNFELLFGTPLDLDFEYVVRMYNGNLQV